jgi:23S rRNA (guanosine2251-2'-O)-methyltransferase
MAFYKDFSKDKKKDHAAQGSWDDEGAHYKKPVSGSDTKSSDKPAFARTGRRPEGAQGAKPAYRGRPGGAQGEKPAYRGRPEGAQGEKPAYRGRPEGAQGEKPVYRGRPEGAQGERPVYRGRPEGAQGERSVYRGRPEGAQGEKPVYRGRPEGAQGEKPVYRGRPEGAQGEKRPYGRPAPRSEFRPAGERPSFRIRPESGEVEKRVYGHPAPRSDFRSNVERPAFRSRPERAEGEKRVYGRPAPARENQNAEPAYKRYEFKPAAPNPTPAPQAEESIDPMENLLSGRNPIREAIKSGRDIEKLLVAKGDLSGSAREIVAMAKEARIPVQEVDRARLDEITRNHQGMLAFASAYQYSTVEDMLAEAKEKGEDPFLILLDGITDPHNLGAVIRTAECVGAHGVIVPERRSVGLTPAAVKASAGAVEHVKVARVGNLNRTLEDLQKAGLWIAAGTTDGTDYQKADLNGPLALVIGSEGEGISRLVLEHCDKTVALPMKGKIGSLNASVAAGILMYAVLASRNKG